MEKTKFLSPLKLIVIMLTLLLTAAQCQPQEQPTPTPEPPTATPVLIPPIQPGDGSDLMDRLLETGVIRVGIRVWPGAEFSPPAFRGFSNAETGGALNGFEVDLARQIADGLGLELELVEAYPPVLATGQWQNEWDIAIALLTPFDSSPEDMAYSIPYGYIPMGVLIPASQNNISTGQHLANKKVGVLQDSVYQRLLSPEGPSLTVNQQPLLAAFPDTVKPVDVSNLLKAINQLGLSLDEQETPNESLDAIFGPAPVLQEAVKNKLPIKVITEDMGVQPVVVAVMPQDNLTTNRLISEINTVLTRLHKNGTLAEIYLRWYEQDFSLSPNSGTP